MSFAGRFADVLGLFACKSIALFLYSYMLLFKRARVFFSRFLLSRNHKIQVIAHVEGKSAVAPSGITEASYSRFFVGLGFRLFRLSWLNGRVRFINKNLATHVTLSGYSGDITDVADFSTSHIVD